MCKLLEFLDSVIKLCVNFPNRSEYFCFKLAFYFGASTHLERIQSQEFRGLLFDLHCQLLRLLDNAFAEVGKVVVSASLANQLVNLKNILNLFDLLQIDKFLPLSTVFYFFVYDARKSSFELRILLLDQVLYVLFANL